MPLGKQLWHVLQTTNSVVTFIKIIQHREYKLSCLSHQFVSPDPPFLPLLLINHLYFVSPLSICAQCYEWARTSYSCKKKRNIHNFYLALLCGSSLKKKKFVFYKAVSGSSAENYLIIFASITFKILFLRGPALPHSSSCVRRSWGFLCPLPTCFRDSSSTEIHLDLCGLLEKNTHKYFATRSELHPSSQILQEWQLDIAIYQR